MWNATSHGTWEGKISSQKLTFRQKTGNPLEVWFVPNKIWGHTEQENVDINIWVLKIRETHNEHIK